jgi:hypothetical protein
LVVNHKFNEKFEGTMTWVYTTGANTTLPIQVYYVNSGVSPDNAVYVYGERNAYKFPNYHRMDLCINYKKERPNFTRIWSVGLYNVYNRLNAFYVTPAYNKSGDRTLQLVSLFPILPNISYKIRF